MLILITEKLVERRDPHLAANRAVTKRLGERYETCKKWRKALMGKEQAAQEQNGNHQSFSFFCIKGMD